MLTIKDEMIEMGEENPKRRRYADGIIQSSGVKLSSVNKLFVIGIMPESQENYGNIELMLEQLNIESIPHSISADLKLDANLVGKQQAACKNPCPWCDCSSDNFGKEAESHAKLLTIGDLKRMLKAWRDAGGKMEDAQLYGSVVKDVLLKYPDDTLILDILNLPELHIILGVVAKILKFLENIIGWDRMTAFLGSINVTRDKGERSSLDGNGSKLFLENADKFESDTVDIFGEARSDILCATACLKAFNEVSI